VKLQEWVKANWSRVVVLFEGRDAADKGSVIKRITQSLNPRVCKVAALGTPTERENSVRACAEPADRTAPYQTGQVLRATSQDLSNLRSRSRQIEFESWTTRVAGFAPRGRVERSLGPMSAKGPPL
jgi:hypothetical protein